MDSLTKLNITWLFGGNPIKSSAKYGMETKLQIILNVNKTNFNDSGTYTAIIANGVESLVVPVNITVRGSINVYLYLLYRQVTLIEPTC